MLYSPLQRGTLLFFLLWDWLVSVNSGIGSKKIWIGAYPISITLEHNWVKIALMLWVFLCRKKHFISSKLRLWSNFKCDIYNFLILKPHCVTFRIRPIQWAAWKQRMLLLQWVIREWTKLFKSHVWWFKGQILLMWPRANHSAITYTYSEGLIVNCNQKVQQKQANF